MVNKFTIKFSTYGSVLTTRRLGRKIRELEIEKRLKNNQLLVFDLSDVELITHSFADECFGKVFLDFELSLVKNRTSFENYNTKVKSQIIIVINHNLKLKSIRQELQ